MNIVVANAPQQPKSYPKFTNAAKIIADPCKDELQIVSVQPSSYFKHLPDGRVESATMSVANITNGSVLIRRVVEGIPEGAYNVNIDGSLSPTVYKHGLKYPYVEFIKPQYLARYDETNDRTKLPILCSLTNEIMGAMIRLCKDIEDVKGSVLIGRGGIGCEQNNNLFLSYEFNIPYPIRLNPKMLSIILVEMLMYPEVKMLRECPEVSHFELNETPLFIGRSWACCALIKPVKGRYG